MNIVRIATTGTQTRKIRVKRQYWLSSRGSIEGAATRQPKTMNANAPYPQITASRIASIP